MRRDPDLSRRAGRGRTSSVALLDAFTQQITSNNQPNSVSTELLGDRHDDQGDEHQGGPGVHDAPPPTGEQPRPHERETHEGEEQADPHDAYLQPEVDDGVERRVVRTPIGGSEARVRRQGGVPDAQPAPTLEPVQRHVGLHLLPQREAELQFTRRVEEGDDRRPEHPGQHGPDAQQGEHRILCQLPPSGG